MGGQRGVARRGGGGGDEGERGEVSARQREAALREAHQQDADDVGAPEVGLGLREDHPGRKELDPIHLLFRFCLVVIDDTLLCFSSFSFRLLGASPLYSPVLLDNLFISLVCFHYFADDLFKSPLVQRIDVYAPQSLVSALKCFC